MSVQPRSHRLSRSLGYGGRRPFQKPPVGQEQGLDNRQELSFPARPPLPPPHPTLRLGRDMVYFVKRGCERSRGQVGRLATVAQDAEEAHGDPEKADSVGRVPSQHPAEPSGRAKQA